MAEDTELAPGAGTDEHNLENKTPEVEDKTPEPSPYDALAQDMGWRPKEEFQGNPEDWKDAETFIRDGRDIQRSTSQELKALRQTVETIGKTSATIVKQEVDRRVSELTAQHDKAVEDGDSKRAFEIAQDISTTLSTKPTTTAPPAEAQMFADRNKGWFQKDALATATAIEVCNRLAAQGYDTKTQLDAAEKEVRRQRPDLFGMNGSKPAPGVHQPGARAPQRQNGPKGFAEMPAEAQKIASDMVSRGVIPDKDAYAKNYWLNAEKHV